jgi:predicted transcriptional regulator
MKAVMISIKPKWVEKICCGNKTIEVRKTRPKIDTPFKCYIYCTQQNIKKEVLLVKHKGKNACLTQWGNVYIDKDCGYGGNGLVIGEFVCDRIDKFSVFENSAVQYWNYHDLEKSCLTYDEISNYIGKNKEGYAWHISDLVIYDEPKEIGEFEHYCEKRPCQTNCWKCDRYDYIGNACYGTITRPPGSWRYIDV